jgi:hypothetical protein
LTLFGGNWIGPKCDAVGLDQLIAVIQQEFTFGLEHRDSWFRKLRSINGAKNADPENNEEAKKKLAHMVNAKKGVGGRE